MSKSGYGYDEAIAQHASPPWIRIRHAPLKGPGPGNPELDATWIHSQLSTMSGDYTTDSNEALHISLGPHLLKSIAMCFH